MDIYGIIGWPVKHSLSPAMHNAAFKELGIDAEYRKFEVKPEDLKDFLLNRKDVKGFNVTVPHKVRAKEILKDKAEVSDCAELCGAINTVKREKGKIKYTNTDVPGFLTSLKKDLGFEHKDKSVILVGCGGAGRAIIAGLITECSKIYVYDNSESAMKATEDAFSKIKDKLQSISKEKMPTIIKNCRLLVNATPIGMKEGDGSPVDKGLLHKDLSVYDVVYNRETGLVKDARSLGLPATGGLGMLLYQGAHAFEFWTGKQAPVEAMRKALLKVVSHKL